MDKKQLFQIVGTGALLLLAAGLLYWSFTRTEEVPIVFSKASLKGKVTYQDKPVPHALIIVSGKETSSTGVADSQGNYFVEHAPAGSVRIGVNTAAGRGMMTGALMAASMSKNKTELPQFVDVPERYFAPETSGLTATLSNDEGLNEFDIKLE